MSDTGEPVDVRVGLEAAYEAGRDSIRSGPNTENYNDLIFVCPELTAAWERGRDEELDDA